MTIFFSFFYGETEVLRIGTLPPPLSAACVEQLIGVHLSVVVQIPKMFGVRLASGALFSVILLSVVWLRQWWGCFCCIPIDRLNDRWGAENMEDFCSSRGFTVILCIWFCFQWQALPGRRFPPRQDHSSSFLRSLHFSTVSPTKSRLPFFQGF